ncbi:hypothetical protein [Streptomyces physcomitrii]|uniref:Uncharacterized protein n=1 Tax=Streptomyces physcomitrii TaxID=2724184 RepID=A0ABX1H7K6_9ACTN|nr:hypothetical protein [Streptomyces physcomitrii]NKI44338.1 hypothetical protein [Streptomyces physcomitrii]
MSEEALPVSSDVLRSDPRVAAEVVRIGQGCGADFTDDEQTRAQLAQRRGALRTAERGLLMWSGGLLLLLGVVLLFAGPALLSKRSTSDTAETTEIPVAAGAAPGAVLLLLGVVLLVLARGRWKRELAHPVLVGYREVLAVAGAHGLPVSPVPDWLVGRSKERPALAPVPQLPYVGGASEAPGTQPSSDQQELRPPQTAPVKSAAVVEYEESENKGGWQGQLGCLTLLAGGIAAGWAFSQDEPAGYIGGAALLAFTVVLWIAAYRDGQEKARLREDALAYARAVLAAQQAGVRVPPLSRRLEEVLDEERESGRMDREGKSS